MFGDERGNKLNQTFKKYAAVNIIQQNIRFSYFDSIHD